MYAIINSDSLILECVQTIQEYSYYVNLSQTIQEIPNSISCVGHLYIHGMLLPPPTPYHTASKGNWVLTAENSILLTQVVALNCDKLQKVLALDSNQSLMRTVSNISQLANKIKAYVRLKNLQASDTKYAQIIQLE